MSRPDGVILIALILFLPACISTSFSVKPRHSRQEYERKAAKVKLLMKDILNQQLLIGTSSRTVRQLYGDPDDAFLTGGTVSSLEVLTYERVDQMPAGGRKPVRLYFDSGRLLSWTY